MQTVLVQKTLVQCSKLHNMEANSARHFLHFHTCNLKPWPILTQFALLEAMYHIKLPLETQKILYSFVQLTNSVVLHKADYYMSNRQRLSFMYFSVLYSSHDKSEKKLWIFFLPCHAALRSQYTYTAMSFLMFLCLWQSFLRGYESFCFFHTYIWALGQNTHWS